MNDMTNAAEVTAEQVQVEAPVAQVEKQKPQKTGDLFIDIAAQVEALTKIKALNLAAALAEDIESNYFKLGGVLQVIYQNAWFEGYESFASFVFERFGFQERKAKYLMEIYTNLVTKQIPWEKVAHLGWTKLKDLARHLTVENVDEWAAKAEKLTVAELQMVLKGNTEDGKESTTNATSDTVKLKFTLKADQAETVSAALNKAKAEVATEFDSVALEMICTGYLGGSVSVGGGNLAAQMKDAGWEAVLSHFEQLFPNINLTASVSE